MGVAFAGGFWVRGQQTNDMLVGLAAQATQEKNAANLKYNDLVLKIQKAVKDNKPAEPEE